MEGTVQGVGFRPFIYTLAGRYALKGTVLNGTHGVEIVITTTETLLETFVLAIKEELPPLASIDKLTTTQIDTISFDDFQIISTEDEGEVTVRIPPDVSVCSQCEEELFDPTNRRYKYPFITCTQCGVRYSIIYDLPYDRVHTSMKFFKMCEVCKEEYSNPLDRRYHAQPIGCYECGPTLELRDNQGNVLEKPRGVEKVAELLKEGNIVAVKGVGGYHLMCDATNAEAIETLRQRKRRPSKPFAVMVRDIQMAGKFAELSQHEERLLTSKERPIVLLQSKGNHEGLPLQIAPNISRLGLFLPYTPLHLLLLDELQRPLVATSANVTDEPICTNLESLEKLQGVYDYVLAHNRVIVNGCDDSVVMVVGGQEVILRRARGYAPASISLAKPLSEHVLALGANQKSTVAIGFDNQVILSPHIGDLDSIESIEYFRKNIESLERIYSFNPTLIAHDKHPNYESTKYAILRQDQEPNTTPATERVEVQHHYAHILGVMAEKKLRGKVFGVVFDGTGYGDDGNLWGGEFMVCDYTGFERVAHLKYFKLLGGAKAIKEPRRVALSLLFDLYGEEVLDFDKLSHLSGNATIQAFNNVELKTHYLAWQKGLNAPLSSSVGRLFDAVASLLGVIQVMSFEGESGMLLEELYDGSVQEHYDFSMEEGKINILPIVEAMLSETDTTVSTSKFFHTLVEMIVKVYEPYDLPMVLSGGVFQNRVLLGLVLKRFPEAVISNAIPPNDGGVALGQVAYFLDSS
ncbi:MAG: [NiFe] hydrogenase metallocenter assembly protein HypF [uncultured Sulfurovum sp.]|uniref:Carbamoyltransferase n=1 Tax=uncultured Sulfurovum sp. TaxID=269237 RepID=A0A6S6SR10_9BACT|nr:MAG: [NiFe] hydrogenase metallocenter assembly protein HypF [uncultured Sulfurovum sp.]